MTEPGSQALLRLMPREPSTVVDDEPTRDATMARLALWLADVSAEAARHAETVEPQPHRPSE